ncbi:Na+/H+ antiporter subunit E [Isoptericola halotolerans]|uniref:Multicomponent Na+:H+ antiporter subunit E n=1 Tax=Isoptericola halotolerans TaxID=300560 RepID=A0ABX2A1J9_9MICO|nr:Na+/H+ antiporter subunit E [Isoptericola halotolerans]NOV95808.1 multicomponent Na+:H+ antiporter subunit E [Isoptericola halotolerans]
MSDQSLRELVRSGLRRALVQWPAVVLLTGVWVLLWGDVSWANLVGGAALAVVVVTLFPLPPVRTEATFRPVAVGRLVVSFAADLFVASFQVAWLALRPGPVPQGAVVQVRLHNPDDVFLTVTAVLATLVPGSLVVETSRRRGTLFLHVLDVEGSGGVEGVRRHVQQLEERVLRAFAAAAVLERTGVAVRPTGRPDPRAGKGAGA